jgi:exosortase H (IPTLxxWG-CTERM-specific)
MRRSERIVRFLSANEQVLRFLVVFVLIFGACYFLLSISPGVKTGIIKPYTRFLASAVAAFINLFGAEAAATGTQVSSARFTIDIATGCDGVEASSLFVAGVLAFPAPWRMRMLGFALGIPAIHAINLLRLVGLYYAGVYLPSLFEELHVYVAQTIVILLSTAILILWLDRFAVQHRQS